jgi:hypothetical protein
MATTEHDTLEVHAAAADSTEQCVEGPHSTTELAPQSVKAEPDVQSVKAEPDVPKTVKTITSNVWVLRRGWALARAALALAAWRLKAEIVTSNTVAALILVTVFAVTSAMILLLGQVMPAWRAALVTSGILAVIGFSLLQTQMVTDVTRAWARTRGLRSEVAERVVELIRIPLRARVRVINRGGPM